MGKLSKKYRCTPKPPPYVPLRWDMLNSSSYKLLIPSAAKLLPYFLGKVKCRLDDPALYTTDFTFTYAEAAWCGYSRSTFRKCYLNLEAKGFIKRTFRGGLRAGNTKVSNRFQLSKGWQQYGDGISKTGIDRVDPDRAEIILQRAKCRLTERDASEGMGMVNISKGSILCTDQTSFQASQCPETELINPSSDAISS